jgi:hypothetical protein
MSMMNLAISHAGEEDLDGLRGTSKHTHSFSSGGSHLDALDHLQKLLRMTISSPSIYADHSNVGGALVIRPLQRSNHSPNHKHHG